MAKYTIGIDFGTLSARAVVVNTQNGEEVGAAVYEYPHGVMTRALPDGTPLGSGWALQHPQDYMRALCACVPAAMRNAGVSKDGIIGIGVDFTASTMLPIDKNGEPLSEKYPNAPHAYVKLWKHHAAHEQAKRITSVLETLGDGILSAYGGTVSSEWMLPKILQLAEEAPEIYDESDKLIEAGDWIVYKLTGEEKRSACIAGYKVFLSEENGFLKDEILTACHPKLAGLFRHKLRGEYLPAGARAGGLTEEMARALGLNAGTPVATAHIDAHVAFPSVGDVVPGSMLMIMGTSTCHIVLGSDKKPVPGMCGAVEGGVAEGFVGYEAGQSCVGDLFGWFTANCVPAAYAQRAESAGLDVHTYLTGLCEGRRAGETGLIALDWWNGNRSVLVNPALSGLLIGMTLETRPEDLYRALLESTAFGTRKIMETFVENGVFIEKVYASGGIAQKNPFLMQLYADVLRREIGIVRSKQASALGSAMFASVAAGTESGGHASIREAARAMGGTLETVYRPIPENTIAYDKLYEEYTRLHDLFGRGENDVMQRLKKL